MEDSQYDRCLALVPGRDEGKVFRKTDNCSNKPTTSKTGREKHLSQIDPVRTQVWIVMALKTIDQGWSYETVR